MIDFNIDSIICNLNDGLNDKLGENKIKSYPITYAMLEQASNQKGVLRYFHDKENNVNDPIIFDDQFDIFIYHAITGSSVEEDETERFGDESRIRQIFNMRLTCINKLDNFSLFNTISDNIVNDLPDRVNVNLSGSSNFDVPSILRRDFVSGYQFNLNYFAFDLNYTVEVDYKKGCLAGC